MDARVQDYLEDRLQSVADLEVLDTLLDSVKSQHELLKRQLDDARNSHDNAKRKAANHSDSVRSKAQAFEKEQGDIDRRLLIVTQSEASDEAVREFEGSMAKLHKLEVATGYVELLKEVEALRNECESQLGKSDEKALAPFRRLQQLSASLQSLQEPAEGAAPHLLNHVEEEALKLRATIRKSFSDDFEKTLKKMHWPKAVEAVPMALQKEWTTNFVRLLNLQRQELEQREAIPLQSQRSDEPPALLPLLVMAEPLQQRFVYHFSGNKPTNRLDKPEYFLSHVTDLFSTYSDFLQNAIQPLLVEQFRGSDLALTPAYIDATSAFITALLPMLKQKLSTFAGQVSSQPRLLSHLVHEVLSFDTTLQETFAYTPASPAIAWRGLAHYLLDDCDCFQPWLAVEREHALTRYREIIDDAKAGELDYDSVASEATKPTKAAIRVHDILEAITDLYRPLASFSQKLRFLMDIQIAIFDDFHQHLRLGLEAYLTLTSSIGRRVQGISREDSHELQGVKGLDRICRIFGSADYLERAMRDWSDDLFFLQLWEELQLRASGSSNAQGGAANHRISRHLGGLAEIKQKTSAAVGSLVGGGARPDDESAHLQGALFDETAGAYARLRTRSEAVLVETLTYNIREALRPYTRVNTWASLAPSSSSASTAAPTSPSPELDPALRLLGEYLSFLTRALGRVPLRRVVRKVCHAVQGVLWEEVLLRKSFSTAGAQQVSVDVGALVGRIDGFVGLGQAEVGLRKLVEGVKLVSLPIRGDAGKKIGGGEEDDDEGAAWDEEGEEDVAQVTEGGEMGLLEVERLVFMDNESARHALQTLGLMSLTEVDARALLERRVEIGNS